MNSDISSNSEPVIVPDGDAQTEVLDEGPRSILLGMISQLRKGMDLHRVALPTFVLEPRSMLERITDFMSHPDLVLEAMKEDRPTERFLDMLRYFLSGWHIRPKGVKKPYNPALGEYFRCRWTLSDHSEAIYVGEQVSHHPPISAFYYAIPDHQIQVSGEMRPRSKFLGNSAASIMDGGTTIIMGKYPKEVYRITFPNVYVRGILFGTMLMELGDSSVFRCDALDLVCELEFITKGFFSGTYNGIKGKVKRISNNEILFYLNGKWTETIFIGKDKGTQDEVFFDANTARIEPKIVRPETEQDEYESRRLWHNLTAALLARNMDHATDEKNKVEDRQRKIRQDSGSHTSSDISPIFHFFERRGDEWAMVKEKDLWLPDGKKRLNDFIFSPFPAK